ncbi:MAG: amidinotransferase [Pyrinomonadaceae bacterium]|nr:amidinotransferase [Pyrinomonadaceae bacterium]
MVRPFRFGFNPETAASNAFQSKPEIDSSEVAAKAREEFDRMVGQLLESGVDVLVVEETGEHDTPDSVFPNNVFSTHPDGTLCVYPMESRARRLERAIIPNICELISVTRTVDFTSFEEEGRFLEGTGSLVLDHDRKLAFACLSSRTDERVLDVWCEQLGYERFVFVARDQAGKRIYHTNVMMCLGLDFAVACVDCIEGVETQEAFRNKIRETGRKLVEIDFEQMNSFAGNMIQVKSKSGSPILLMSESAYRSLTGGQLETLGLLTEISSFSIPTIEESGGGSVRCMVAELFEATQE